MNILNLEGIRTAVTKEQKEAVSLLSIGTFLEYFDLMLYVHMAVLLNELFFPKTDPHTAQLLTAFAFCSTFVFRPIGAILFGWLGDNLGRKTTVIITTLIMSVSCIVMANLQTYAEIGITASIIAISCRVLQGMSSMGEIIGAFVYVVETINSRKTQYMITAWLVLLSSLGGTAALGVAALINHYSMDWRTVFWIGAAVAIVGSAARTALRETPDFIAAKLSLENATDKANAQELLGSNYSTQKRKVSLKTAIAAFLIECAWPLCFYIAFIYCGDLLKIKFGFTPEQVIQQNFWVSVIEILGILPLIYLAKILYPLTILRYRLIIFSLFLLVLPYLLTVGDSPSKVLFIQSFIMFFAIDTTPAKPILILHFPVLKRFTYAGLVYALSRAFMYVIVSIATVYLVESFGYYGLLMIVGPIFAGYAFGLNHFKNLEIESGDYPGSKSSVDSIIK